jgi:hypothetical protein
MLTVPALVQYLWVELGDYLTELGTIA